MLRPSLPATRARAAADRQAWATYLALLPHAGLAQFVRDQEAAARRYLADLRLESTLDESRLPRVRRAAALPVTELLPQIQKELAQLEQLAEDPSAMVGDNVDTAADDESKASGPAPDLHLALTCCQRGAGGELSATHRCKSLQFRIIMYTVKDGKVYECVLSGAAFKAALATLERKTKGKAGVALYIHGFRTMPITSHSDATTLTNNSRWLYIPVMWPSYYLWYPSCQRLSTFVGGALATHLASRDVCENPYAHAVAHSMGNNVIAWAARALNLALPLMSTLVMVAADVPQAAFVGKSDDGTIGFALLEVFAHVEVLWSPHDRALWLSEWFMNWDKRLGRRGLPRREAMVEGATDNIHGAYFEEALKEERVAAIEVGSTTVKRSEFCHCYQSKPATRALIDMATAKGRKAHPNNLAGRSDVTVNQEFARRWFKEGGGCALM